MKRLLLFVHRWLGILLCVLVCAWTLSGFVMMYVPYPAVGEAQRLDAQRPLSFARCCDLATARETAGDFAIAGFDVEMLADDPVLRLETATGSALTLDLRSGAVIDSITADRAGQVAAQFGRAQPVVARPRLLGIIDRDQWTVSRLADDRPLYKFALDDAAGTQFYVSGSSGRVVQRTTAAQRDWNYVGAVTHWIYPTLLRERVRTWSGIVIGSSLSALVLVLAGLYIGWTQWRPRRPHASPYRGLTLWHHYAGLAFGLLALAWIGSGLLSMNPWGLLEPGSSGAERARLAGLQLRSGAALDVMQRLVDRAVPGDVRLVRSAPFDGSLFLVEYAPLGEARVDAVTLQPAAIGAAALHAAAARLAPGTPVRSAELIGAGDDYYYAHHFAPPFPVYRVVLADADESRYYVDPRDGSLLRKLDANGRWWRWLFSAPHQWDFAPALRRRPVWDVVVIALLSGLSLLALSGVWLGIRHLRRVAIIRR